MKKFYFLIVILVFSFSSLIAQINLQDGLVAYYPFNGNANDASGSGNNGFVLGATLTTDRFGNANKAYSFDGVSNYIITPVNSGFTTQISLCAWFKTSYNNYGGILCSRNDAYMSNDITTDYNGNPGIHLTDGIAANQSATGLSPAYFVNDNNWHLLVGTYDGNTLKIYVDGLLRGQKSSTFSIVINKYFKIGWDDLSGYNRYFNGKIDDVRIYKRSLNKSEVFQLFKDGVCTCSIKNDTTTYSVVSEKFKTIGPVTNYLRSDSLKTKVGGCDSLITRYAKFIYDPNTCTITKSISVTDTLVINLTLTANKVLISNVLKLYPNPTKDFLNIDYGDYNNMSGYLVAIRNEIGNIVFLSPVTQKSTTINIKNWGKGIYIVQIIDSASAIIETKKIIIR
jgi:hypothetical protein